MARTSKDLIFGIFLSILVAISLAAPLIGNSTNTELSIYDGGEPSGNGVFPLHPRSPMNPAGPSGGQNPQGTGSVSSTSAAGALLQADALLRTEKRGRDFFLKLVLGDLEEVNVLLDTDVGQDYHGSWQTTSQLETYKSRGWSEIDFSKKLKDSHFMDKFATTFNNKIIGHGQEQVMLHGVENLRNPSRVVWPEGPNRLLRLAQDKEFRWKTSGPSYGEGPATNAYYDVIYNLKDGVMILLRQLHPEEAIEEGKPAFRDPLAHGPRQRKSAQYDGPKVQFGWSDSPAEADPARLWFAEWHSQRSKRNAAIVSKYTGMDPRQRTGHVIERLDLMQSLSTIIVPENSIAFQPMETAQRQLDIVDACLRSSTNQDHKRPPLYKEYGSFYPFGTWCANALLATPPNNDIAMFLARHKQAAYPGLRHKTIVGVSIFRLDGDSAEDSSPALMWEVADFTNKDTECAKAWGAFKFGEKLPLVPTTADEPQHGEDSARGTGDQRATASHHVPEQCYPDIMKAWRNQGASHAQTASGGTADDPMDVDEGDNGGGDSMEGQESSRQTYERPGAIPGGTADDPMDVDEDDNGGGDSTGGQESSGQTYEQPGAIPHRPGQSENDPLRRLGVLPGGTS